MSLKRICQVGRLGCSPLHTDVFWLRLRLLVWQHSRRGARQAPLNDTATGQYREPIIFFAGNDVISIRMKREPGISLQNLRGYLLFLLGFRLWTTFSLYFCC